jgi:hypothetical protein
VGRWGIRNTRQASKDFFFYASANKGTFKLDVEPHNCNPSTLEAEAGE